jgi:hypothetical protein
MPKVPSPKDRVGFRWLEQGSKSQRMVPMVVRKEVKDDEDLEIKLRVE